MIYLDNAAATKPCAECVGAMNAAFEDAFANAGSLHKAGTSSLTLLGRARSTVLNAFSRVCGAGEGEVIFTSGATESNNLALLGANLHKNKIVTTAVEHPSVARVMDELEKRGHEVLRLCPKDHEDFERAVIDNVDEKTALVSCMAVNNETGRRFDVKKIYDGAKRKNPRTLVHVDAVQGFLKVPLAGDLISASGHKIHAVKGIGALYIKKGVTLSPVIFGGGQQKNLRSGTEPVDLAAGFAAAVEAYKYDFERFSALKGFLLERLSKIGDVKINSDDRCLPNIINFSVRGVRSEIMLHALEESEIFVSSGSACARGKLSGVLSAFGVSDGDADCALRVSLCAENSESDLEILAEKLSEAAQRLRR